MSPIETVKHRAEFDKLKNKVINERQENMNGGICILQNSQMSIKQVFMEQVHQQIDYLKEVKNNGL